MIVHVLCITGTWEAEDFIKEISFANEAGVCVCEELCDIQIITLVTIVMACFTNVELLEQGWDTPEEEEDDIPKKKHISPKPLPSEYSIIMYMFIYLFQPCSLYPHMYMYLFSLFLFFCFPPSLTLFPSPVSSLSPPSPPELLDQGSDEAIVTQTRRSEYLYMYHTHVHTHCFTSNATSL